MNEFIIDLKRIEALSEDYNSELKKLENNLNSIYTQLLNLSRSGAWVGQSSELYLERLKKDKKSIDSNIVRMVKLGSVLQSVSIKLNKGVVYYNE